LSQLWVKVAVSVMGLPILTEAGLVVPENEPVPLPVQLVKLRPMACAAIVQVRATECTSDKAYGVGVGVGDALTTV
jgi:hypothetical protein